GVFQNEVLGIFAGLDVLQALAHSGAGLVGDDARAGDVLAVFRVVGNGVVHVGDAALVDQVHDQLQFMQALEVRHFRCVPGFSQRFETGLDEFHGTAAQHGLFAEQVGFGLFAEGRFDDARAAAADSTCVRQRDVTRGTRLVLVNGNQGRHAAALVIGATHSVTGRLGGDHDDVDVFARLDLAIVHVEAMGERQGGTSLDVAGHVIAIHL